MRNHAPEVDLLPKHVTFATRNSRLAQARNAPQVEKLPAFAFEHVLFVPWNLLERHLSFPNHPNLSFFLLLAPGACRL